MRNGTLFMAAAAVLVGTGVAGQTMTADHVAIADANGDGAIQRAEFEKFMTVTFETLDKNADGALTKGEAKEVISEEAFAIADVDRDGVISATEFTATVTREFEQADLDGDGSLN